MSAGHSMSEAVEMLLDWRRAQKAYADQWLIQREVLGEDGLLTGEAKRLCDIAHTKLDALTVVADWLLEREDSPECAACGHSAFYSGKTIDGLTLCVGCEPKRGEFETCELCQKPARELFECGRNGMSLGCTSCLNETRAA